ncbi:MAG TPA: sodium-dependent bicarbonate transport family permease [Methylomirabilota bacterium]|nr:sodium-dependent bicarbonate transport family permease [Methylomirabilota bacterium]
MELIEAVKINLLSPAILFFVIGMAAALLKSDLRFPEPLYVGLTIYLLAAIGFKGGVAVSNAGIGKVLIPALAAVALGIAIPIWCYFILRKLGKFTAIDSAAIGAHYGSVSVVTFIAAVSYLKEMKQDHEMFATALLAIMESPAIVVGIILGKLGMSARSGLKAVIKPALHEAVFGRSVFLLLGAMAAGYLSGERGAQTTAGLFVAPFQEMGMVAARRFNELKKVGLFLIGFGVLMPLFNGACGVVAGKLVGLSLGGGMLMGVLAASASYIAAPAAIRLSLPEANPTLYLTSALAITFPFNITLGLPIYYEMALWWYGK